ncbi:hypothetical protein NDA18_004140 [Ustilago nuda]|nr:hypothetical protein NDA18_004140 [Ustilago nuda]
MPATAGSYILPLGRASLRSRTSMLPSIGVRTIPVQQRSLHSSSGNFLNSALPSVAASFPQRSAFHTSANLRLPPTAETASYRFNHVMIRVKDPKVSLKFYEDVLGMDLIDRHDASDFSLYFLAYQHQKDVKERGQREAILELTHNHGTENDENFSYHNGNNEPKGFGHLCIAVDDIEKACERFEKLGVKFQKKLTDGKMKNIAFILDPDNYWIEIISTSRPQ